MKILKKNNEYYRKLCQGYKANTAEAGTNTIEFLDSQVPKALSDKESQIQSEEKAQLQRQVWKEADKKDQERKER